MMPATCGSCQLDTAGNHEWNCPMHPRHNQGSSSASIIETQPDKQHEIDTLRTRVAELEKLLDIPANEVVATEQRVRELEILQQGEERLNRKLFNDKLKAEALSAKAKTALEAVKTSIGARSCLDDFADGLTDAREMVDAALTDPPALPDLAAARITALGATRMIKHCRETYDDFCDTDFSEVDEAARRYLKSIGETP